MTRPEKDAIFMDMLLRGPPENAGPITRHRWRVHMRVLQQLTGKPRVRVQAGRSAAND